MDVFPMTRHYLRLALRRLRRDANYALINLVSLIVGLACCFSFLLVIAHEVGHDRSFSEADRLYRIAYRKTSGDIQSQHARGPSALGPALEQSFSEVEAATVLIGTQDMLARRPAGDLALQNLFRATPHFFEVFDFPMLHGDAATALAEPNSIVLTYDTALRLFGEPDVIGRIITLGEERGYSVTGVLTPDPPRSHLQFEALLHMPQGLLSLWNGTVAATYVQVKPNTDPAAFTQRLNAYIDRHATGRWGEYLDAFLQPVPWIHLTSHLQDEVRANGSLRMLGVLALAAVLILLMAVLNYVNLSTARSASRGREIGVRKVIGAERRQLIGQFLGESVLLALLAVPAAMLLLFVLHPALHRFTGVVPSLDAFTVGVLCTGAILLCGVVGLGAGAYPAFVLSGFHPIQALRGMQRPERGVMNMRQFLTGSQLFVTLLFVLTATVMVAQLRYITNKDLGFEPEQVLYVRLWDRITPSRYETFKRMLLKDKAIRAVSYGRLPGEHSGVAHRVRDASGRSLDVYRFHFGPGYTETLGIEMVAGQAVTAHDKSTMEGLLLNETAADLLDTSLGDKVQALGEARPVVGIMKDFHFFSLHQPLPPVQVVPSREPGPDLLIRKENEADMSEVRSTLAAMWHQFLPETPFAPHPLTDRLQIAYTQERQLTRLLAIFSTVAIAIAHLGLFAMVSYVLQRRQKEIAIRRVLGASTLRLGLRLSSNSVGLYVAAAVAALGTVFIASSWWLREFAYRVTVSPLTFGAVLVMVLLITLTAVWYQVVRVTATPPARAIRQS